MNCETHGEQPQTTNGRCLECKREADRAYAAAHREEYKTRAKAWYRANRPRAYKNFKRWRLANPERVREIEAKSRGTEKAQLDRQARCRTRRSRLRQSAGQISPAEWQAIIRAQRGRCNECKKKKRLTIDHIVPVAMGGSSYAFNMQGLCMECNRRKGSKIESGTQHNLFDKVAS